MQLNISIATNKNGEITVTDSTEYVDESSTVITKGEFKFSETIAIDVIKLNGTKEISVLNTVQTPHEDLRQTTISLSLDGWISVVHIVLPTKEWVEEQLNSEESALGIYTYVYFADGEKLYKYFNGTVSIVEIDEILEINTENTTISIAEDDLVAICLLIQCYIDTCKDIFNSDAFSSCWNSDGVSSEQKYKRDMLLMALNVIRYLVECDLLAEAERIIENISGCNGLCSSSSTSSSNGSKCGCGCN